MRACFNAPLSSHRSVHVEFCIRKSADRGETGESKREREREKEMIPTEREREREKFGGREARGRRRGEIQRGRERPREALEVGRR